MATPPTFITPIDPTTILADVIADYEARTNRTLYPAQVEHLLLNSWAYRESLLRAAVQDTAEQNLVDFARAPALDYLGTLVGVNRLAAQPAGTTILFTLVSGHLGVTIPALTRVASTDGRAVFLTMEAVSVASGVTTATVEGECQSTGTIGNGYIAGSVTNLLDPQAYITAAANTNTTGGGADIEGDDALRERIKLAPEAFTTAGSYGAYRFHARAANAGIIDVAVLGHSDDPGVPLGSVWLFPLMEAGSATPSSVILAVEAACNAETVRPLNDSVAAFSPTPVNYTLAVALDLYIGADGSTVQAAVTAALNSFAEAKRQKLGRDIVGTQIIAAVHAAAPEDIYEVTLTGWADVSISPTQFGKNTSLSVTISGYVNG